MSEDEESLRFWESRFAFISGAAFFEARRQTLAAGLSVLESQNGVIYEVFPDGTRIERKRIEAPKRFAKGTIFHLS